jgi:hypothetical protein
MSRSNSKTAADENADDGAVSEIKIKYEVHFHINVNQTIKFLGAEG